MPAPTLPTGVRPESAPYLSDELLESIKRRTRMPIAQATWDVWDLLRIADEQIRTLVAPLMISEAEDYLTATQDVPIAGATVYRPPARSMKLREVQFVDDFGNVADVPRIALENLPYAAWGFYLLGESVRLVGRDQFDGLSLRMTYYLRPSKLVQAADAGVVSVIAGGSITLHDANLADGATTVDLVRGVAPFEVVAMDVPATVAGTAVTVDAGAVPDGFGAGDFVCAPQECPGVQVHPDLVPLVAQAAAVSILDGNGEAQNYDRAVKIRDELFASAKVLLSQRVEGEPIPLGGGYHPLWDRTWR